MSIEQDMGILASTLQGAKDHAALTRVGAYVERLRTALKPFAEVADDERLRPMYADDTFPVSLGLINGNVCQTVIERKLHVSDLRRAANAYQQRAPTK